MRYDVKSYEVLPNASPELNRHLWTAWLVSTVVIALAIGFLTLTPAHHVPRGDFLWDKLAHLIAFLVLVLPTAALWPRVTAWVGALAVVYAGAIEVIQPYAGRSAELGDLIADGIGIALGIILGTMLRRVYVARRAVAVDRHRG